VGLEEGVLDHCILLLDTTIKQMFNDNGVRQLNFPVCMGEGGSTDRKRRNGRRNGKRKEGGTIGLNHDGR
jgi:hypothetical protein